MANKIKALTLDQQHTLNQIVSTGIEMNANSEIIEAAVNIANAESTFNPEISNKETKASGLFQYTAATWDAGWRKFQRTHADNLLSSMSSGDALWDSRAQIQVMYQKLNEWHDGYDQGLIAKDYLPGGGLHHVSEELNNSGIDIKHDFLNYAYLMHNTNVNQILTVNRTAFTPENLLEVKKIVFNATSLDIAGNESRKNSEECNLPVIAADGDYAAINVHKNRFRP